MEPNRQPLRGVSFKRDDWWVAVCLDHYLVTQTRLREDLPSAIMNMLLAHVIACSETGAEPFQGLPPAPRRYWQMFEALAEQPTLKATSPENAFLSLPSVEFRQQLERAA